MKSSIKNSGEIQTKEPYIKCKWCIYALCSKILIVNHKVIFDYLFKSSYMPV